MRTASLKSAVVKRSIVVSGHKTSVSLEDAFWKGLKEIAGGRHLSLSDLIARIDSDREYGNLSSAIRLFVLDFYRGQLSRLEVATDEGHGQAGTQTRPFAWCTWPWSRRRGDRINHYNPGQSFVATHESAIDTVDGEQLVAANRSNMLWQRDLSVSFERIGNVLMAQGKLDEALEFYRDDLNISERLAAADRSPPGLELTGSWQPDGEKRLFVMRITSQAQRRS
jgi:predicted DNA-binding ribbon-helix-helix protein